MRVILELGCNHNGSLATAKRMIDDAVRLGVYGVKIQKRDIDSLPDELKNKPRDPKTSFGSTYYEHRKALEFNEQQVMQLRQYAEERGLILAVSVFDKKSMSQMIDCSVRYVKLPSQFYSDVSLNDALLEYRAHFSSPMCDSFMRTSVSTGMHTTDEVLSSEYLGLHDVTYYCRSIYPFETFEQADIGSAIAIYAQLDKEQCGYSSHDKDGFAIPEFVRIGAQWIERHYTLDKNMKGSDHGTVSSDFTEMRMILRKIDDALEMRYAHKLCGEEMKVREVYMSKR